MSQKPFTVTKLGRVSDFNRDFDLVFWQNQSPAERMAAVWDLVVFHHTLKKRPTDELDHSEFMVRVPPDSAKNHQG